MAPTAPPLVLAALACPLIGAGLPADACDDGGGSMSLLQTALGARRAPAAPRASVPAVALASAGADSFEWQGSLAAGGLRSDVASLEPPFGLDMHGRPCAVCDPVLEERVDRQYTRRTDCGNHTVFGHDDMKLVPLISFKRAASDTEPETNAWCETNVQTVCADSLWNRDFLYQAKTVDYRRDLQWDPHYCLFNGWLEPEVVALQHDFEGLKRKSEEVCQEEKYAFAKWNTTMTMSDMDEVFQPSMARGTPTPREAIFMGAWTCAMGSSGCDMAYCAYSFCKLPDGSLGKYDDCEGWDPVKGMPIHPAPTGKHGR